MYVSTKNYGHERGYAVAYRQHRAESHCNQIHGYALAFYFEFESLTLDVRNWTVDFGSLKTLKENLLDYYFDHTMLVAKDDPKLEKFQQMERDGLCKLREFEKVGCEGLSEAIYHYVNDIWIPDNGYGDRVHCRVVKVSETPTNSAWFEESWDEFYLRRIQQDIVGYTLSVIGTNDKDDILIQTASDIYSKIITRNITQEQVTEQYVIDLYNQKAYAAAMGNYAGTSKNIKLPTSIDRCLQNVMARMSTNMASMSILNT